MKCDVCGEEREDIGIMLIKYKGGEEHRYIVCRYCEDEIELEIQVKIDYRKRRAPKK
jgi:hypothetical protein